MPAGVVTSPSTASPCWRRRTSRGSTTGSCAPGSTASPMRSATSTLLVVTISVGRAPHQPGNHQLDLLVVSLANLQPALLADMRGSRPTELCEPAPLASSSAFPHPPSRPSCFPAHSTSRLSCRPPSASVAREPRISTDPPAILPALPRKTNTPSTPPHWWPCWVLLLLGCACWGGGGRN
ncbi:Glutathione S-transferase TCHQD [Zea mays]|uniref:Glutathione S-transferase TCHQD n=1 Tax=Zea mays TaxID=4577 RepID=A0A1D6EAB4_MAIZE|nr:Glutathione S-transferase TCHQD [Zea mays]